MFNASGDKITITDCLPHNCIILLKYSQLRNNIKNGEIFGQCWSSSGFSGYKSINWDVERKVYTA
jgi:hypothetical protein